MFFCLSSRYGFRPRSKRHEAVAVAPWEEERREVKYKGYWLGKGRVLQVRQEVTE